jgi:hypothetical protein
MAAGQGALHSARDMAAVLQQLLGTIENLPERERGVSSLAAAAKLVETAAYDLAGGDNAPRVARLILLSDELSRVAAFVRADAAALGEAAHAC